MKYKIADVKCWPKYCISGAIRKLSHHESRILANRYHHCIFPSLYMDSRYELNHFVLNFGRQRPLGLFEVDLFFIIVDVLMIILEIASISCKV